MEDADLVKLPAAVDARHERLHVEQVVLLFVEVLLLHVTEKFWREMNSTFRVLQKPFFTLADIFVFRLFYF